MLNGYYDGRWAWHLVTLSRSILCTLYILTFVNELDEQTNEFSLRVSYVPHVTCNET